MNSLRQLCGAVLASFALICIAVADVKAENSNSESNQAQSTYSRAWQTVRDSYFDSEYGGQDWSVWEHRFDGKLCTTEDAQNAISTMLASLHDPYSKILKPMPKDPSKINGAIASIEHLSEPVSSALLDGNIAYIKISSFASMECAHEVRMAIKNMAGAKAIVLDLRSNPGGLVSNALRVADMFLAEGEIVKVISRTGKESFTASGDQLSTQPLAVLVNDGSASASEILTAALKDNHRATVVGSKTYGKGLVQEESSLPGGAVLRITVARYLTPSGADVNRTGIMPDIELSSSNDAKTIAVKLLNTQ